MPRTAARLAFSQADVMMDAVGRDQRGWARLDTADRIEEDEPMLIEVVIAKLHRATVTEADLNYVGSITIDEDLLDASGMRQYQYVNITNVSNGVFWRTYIMAGPRGHGDICLNGPPARHFQPGDKIIVLAEGWIEPNELPSLNPVVVFVDDHNRVTEVQHHSQISREP
jgi:aspartate 1-decarboxylase